MNPLDKIRLFGLSHLALERELDRVEHALGVDLDRGEPDEKDDEY